MLYSIRRLLSPKTSIQGKIFIAFSLVTLLAIVAVASTVYMYMRETVKNNALTSVMDSMRQADESLNLRLEEIRRLSTVVVTNQTVLDTLMSSTEEASYEWFQEQKRTEEFLSAVVAYKPYISRVAVIGLNEKVFKVGLPWIDKRVLDTQMMDYILENGSVQAYFHQADSNDSIVAGRVIRYDQKVIGVVLFNLNDDFIRKTYNVEPTSESKLYVIDRKNEFIHLPENSTLDPEHILQLNEKLSGTDVAVEEVIDKKSYLAVSRVSEYTGWSTLVLVPMKSLFNESVRIRNIIVQVAIIVFIIIVITTVQVSSRITLNIRRLRSMMLHVMDGNLSFPAAEIRSKDEIGQLYLVYIKMIEELKQLLEGIQTTEREKREAELAVLQAQIRPHFLYNTLNTVKYLAKLNNVPNIVEVTESLIELMRGVLGNTMEFLTVEEELNYVRSYVTIVKYKYLEPIDLQIEVVDEELLQYNVLKLMLQPIIENAIIHGITSSEQGGLVQIRIYKQLNELRIEVIDNGKGMTEEQIQALFEEKQDQNYSRFSGMGIRNVHERIRRLYGEPYGVLVHSEPDAYTNVQIRFPLILDRENK